MEQRTADGWVRGFVIEAESILILSERLPTLTKLLAWAYFSAVKAYSISASSRTRGGRHHGSKALHLQHQGGCDDSLKRPSRQYDTP
nr:hypothetical protein CFP56_46753 [Quercus suber]